MPMKAPGICLSAGCLRRQAPGSRYCAGCQGTGIESRERGTRQERGYGAPHQLWRLEVLAMDPICHWPIGYPNGKRTGARCQHGASVADHVIPRKLRPDLALDPDNGQGLCGSHHNVKTRLERERGIAYDTRSGSTIDLGRLAR